MEPLKDIMLDMQESGKLPRNLKNPAERQLFQELISQGWEVTKKGFPDFACFKDGNLALIEVKPSKRLHLRRNQYRLMTALAKLGVKCFIWSPDGGLEPVTPTSIHLAPRQKWRGGAGGRGERGDKR